MKKILVISFLTLLAGCAGKVVEKKMEPQVIYKPNCKKEIAADHVDGIRKSVKKFCGERKVVRITMHKCLHHDDGSFAAEVSYLCETP